MSDIQTLVYCDIEATGLKSSGRPRITEISLVAVKTEKMLDLNAVLINDLKKSSIEVERLLPRVMNKLTVCVYPMAIIPPNVSDLTGLDNYNLSGQATFDQKTGELINSFLHSLVGPVCLVAHNGNLYDFPLLIAEMKKAGITPLGDIMCADSYVGIKEITKKKEQYMNKQEHYKDTEYSDLECEHPKVPTKSFSRVALKRKHRNCKNLSNRKLTATTNSNICPGGLSSYSLINLHRQLLGSSPAQSHGSEADCVTLIRTTAVFGMEWVKWVQKNCYPLSNVTRMWSMQNM